MKFRLVEDVNDVTPLTEDMWYKVDFSPDIDIKGTKYNHIYVWAKNNGVNQVKDIVNNAIAGLYTGRNKEQSFNRNVADALRTASKLPGFKLGNITDAGKNVAMYAPNVLSRTDRGMRKYAHEYFSNMYLNHLAKTYPDCGLDFDAGKFLIHHHNEGRREDMNNLNDLVIIPYDVSGVDLPLAQVGHQLIHAVTNNCQSAISTGVHKFDLYDFSSGKPVHRTVTINIR